MDMDTDRQKNRETDRDTDRDTTGTRKRHEQVYGQDQEHRYGNV